MAKQNRQIRMKFEFEDFPILDVRKQLKNEAELEDLFDGIRGKLFGKK